MSGLAEIVASHGTEYLDTFGDRMLPSHKRALADILACRTEAMGGNLCECEECGHQHYAYHSCKNRSCPTCHSGDTKKWLAKREIELLPIRYFHVVFTIPSELRDSVRSNQKQLYAVLMRAAVDTLQKIGLDPHFVGGQLSMLAVLHTWTRALEFHPHVHMLVPGGGLDKDGVWRSARKKFLVPVEALSRMFRARFMKLARKALPQETFSKEVWNKEWVVFCKPTFNRARKVLRYLGRYVHRIAITNNRILATKDGNVTFRYQESKNGTWKTMTLQAGEFLRRYLQHVLPQGFHKVRYYGMLSPANRVTLKRVQLLLAQRSRNKEEDKQETPEPAPKNICPCCKEGIMVIISWLPRKPRSPPG
jgi:Putative transposase/Transposase zinc-binding domain